MSGVSITPRRLVKVRGNCKAVSLTAVREKGDWVVTVYVRHQSPGGRDAMPWQAIDRYRLPGGPVADHEAVLSLVGYLAGERTLPGIG